MNIISNKIKDLGLEANLINHEGLTPGMLVTLGEQKILNLEDFYSILKSLCSTNRPIRPPVTGESNIFLVYARALTFSE